MTRTLRTFQTPDGYLAVGRIVGAHGLTGEVKIELYTDYPNRFTPGLTLFLGDSLEPITVQSARPHKGHLLLAFGGVADRTQADELRGEWLFVAEEDAVALDENTYWVHDILGLKVASEDGEALGVVREVIFTGANEVYVVRATESDKEILLPAIEDVIREIDLSARTMTVHLLPGLRDEP